uniref:Uncharacterized protein n=1 Tax=viral metagenome TaxID=1070528 RepID=A0A6C0CZM3_9ZZZZ
MSEKLIDKLLKTLIEELKKEERITLINNHFIEPIVKSSIECLYPYFLYSITIIIIFFILIISILILNIKICYK